VLFADETHGVTGLLPDGRRGAGERCGFCQSLGDLQTPPSGTTLVLLPTRKENFTARKKVGAANAARGWREGWF